MPRPRIFGAAIVAMSMLALSPAAALAGESHYYNTAGGPTPDGSDGYIRAKVTVNFPSKKAYDVKGWVEDMCPGDGKGGYVTARMGTTTETSIWSLGKDTNGCGNGKVRFDPAPYRNGTILSGIRVEVCERDTNGDGDGPPYCESHWFDNWRV